MSRGLDGVSEARAAAPAHALADLLRTLPESRLRRATAGESVAQAALRIAQLLADTAAGIHDRDAAAPTMRQVPDLGPFALPDQLTVTATELDGAARGLDASTQVWAPDGKRSTLGAVLGVVASRTAALLALA